ncbi:MAG: SAVED domain-containing protein [Acidimicrobiaceae bacterium]|nr:SAVED domain-containing protein [Acidimicrobiaceae bacterium]MYG56566.1 SAVED domain-containing protein [Acidimicrobiaceae bacterium]MYJ98274.1 SAVED domain-containing protein [Acidimicrobiaceae bacterium]
MATHRKQPKERERLKVWVHAGGHCTICHRYLLESGINFEYVRLGELAHIVAQSDSERAPRGSVGLSKEERDLAENLMLVCAHCHNDIDKESQAQRLDAGWLRELKKRHETRIRAATGLAEREMTVVLRLVGRIRGAPTEVSALEAADAVNSLLDRNPVLTLDPNRRGPEIDLRSFPGEEDPIDSGYYETACARIDQILVERLTPAVERGEVPHLSVFGLARLPLLVYFGSRVDDAISTEIFQRHRSTESWRWAEDVADVQFNYRLQEATNADRPTEAVLIVNASGTIDSRQIPIRLACLPSFVIEPEHSEPNRDVIRTQRSRDSFHDTVSRL